MSDICQFIPPKEHSSELLFFHFVYQTDVNRLKQPFLRENYYAHIVFKGNATLKTDGKFFSLKRGDVFFTLPYQSYSLDGEDDFSYLYISFNGGGAKALVEEHGISKDNCVFKNMEHMIDFWIESIRRVRPSNANTVTESVLLYTFSFIENEKNERFNKIKDKFDSILDYLSLNFTSPDLSIKKTADLFFYTEKYLSHLFLKKTGMKFTQYINELRINYAIKLMQEKDLSLDEFATRCGFNDRFYFSKVFKKITNKTPTVFLQELKK